MAANAGAASVRAPDAIIPTTINTKAAIRAKVLYVECFSTFEEVMVKGQIKCMIRLVSNYARYFELCLWSRELHKLWIEGNNGQF